MIVFSVTLYLLSDTREYQFAPYVKTDPEFSHLCNLRISSSWQEP